MSSQKHYHDPINYLRAARDDDAVTTDWRRYDSDDEGPAVALESHHQDYSLDGIDSSEGAITKSGAHNKNNSNVQHPKPPPGTEIPSPSPDEERKAYRPQSVGTQPQPPARARPGLGAAWPYRETLSFTRNLIFYGAGSITPEHERACQLIQQARALRQTYCNGHGTVVVEHDLLQDYANLSICMGPEGVVELHHNSLQKTINLVQVPNVELFSKDYSKLVEICSEGAMRSFCFQRLQMLSTSFKMHTTVNATIEMHEQSNLLGNDFYRTMKVDNHIHAAAAPSAKQFVQFVREKLETEADTVVWMDKVKNEVDGTEHEVGKTLAQVYQEAGLDADHLTIDAFNVLADYSVYQRFDNFNSKYSPFRMANMRRIFLKTENHIGGRYFAELLKIVLNRHNISKGHKSACEMRLSVYGMERSEWYDLAVWMTTDWKHPEFPGKLVSPDNRWLVQIPRLWRIYSTKPVPDGQPPRAFCDMLANLFVPLFDATLDPDGHPEIAEAMTHIVGFDSVDDEGALEETCSCQRPHEWTTSKNPSYWWQLYYLWANLEVLNRLRRARNLNTFAFRPHAGETGDPMHLAAAYLLCDSINHGIELDAQVSLQYLYYLDQVGLSMSPLSNNFLFRKIVAV